MITQLILFELRYHSRQAIFRATALIFLLLGFAFSQGRFGQSGVLNNSPFTTAVFTALMSLGTVIVIALLAGGAVLRDRESGMEPIIYATNLTHSQYVISRFCGLLVAVITAFIPGVLGLFLGSILPIGNMERFGDTVILPYLWSLLVIAVPNILLGCTIVFATAALTRNAMATYISGVLLYIIYWLASMYGNSPIMAQSNPIGADQQAMASLLEPYGLVAVLEATRYWSVPEKNMTLIPLAGSLLINRLAWIAFSLGLFALTYRLFSFRMPSAKKIKAVLAETRRSVMTYRPIRPVPAGFVSALTKYRSVAAVNLRLMMRGYPFYAMMLMWIVFAAINMTEGLHNGDFGKELIPNTTLLVPNITEPLRVFGSLMMIFFAAELVWLARTCRMDPLLDVTPVENGVLWAGQFTALAALPMIFGGTAVTIGLAIQFAVLGYIPADWPIFVDLIPLAVLPLILTGIVAALIQNLVANKYVGMGLSTLIIVFFSQLILPQSLFFEHPLLQFLYMPEMLYSNMVERAYHHDAMLLYLLYWCGFGLILAALIPRVLHRGAQRMIAPLGIANKIVAVAGMVLFASTGAYIYYRLDIVNGRLSKDASKDLSAAYEQAYMAFDAQPQPTVSAANTQLELFPAKRAFDLKGKLSFENQTDSIIRDVAMYVDNRVASYTLDIPGAQLFSADPRFNQLRYRFDQPLAPGDSGTLSFQLHVRRDSFRSLDPECYVLPGAAYVEVDKWLPAFGINHRLLLTNSRDRIKRKLTPRQDLPPAGDEAVFHRDHVQLTFSVTTDADQTIVAPYERQDATTTGARKTQVFTSPSPTLLHFAVATGRYVSKTMNADGVTVTAYTHPDHQKPVDSILAASKASLAYYRSNFGPFPHPGIEIAEIPAFSDRFGATAYPGAVFAVENRGFQFSSEEDGFNASYRMAAHEIAHMYWGQQLEPAMVAGARFLTETLAEYSEMVIYQRSGLPGDAWYHHKNRDLYFYMRGFDDDPEPPLVATQSEPYVHYFKGAHVVHALHQLLGEDTINGILSNLLKTHAYPRKPMASDLAAQFLAAAQDEDKPVVRELLYEVVTYDLALESAEMLTDGDVSQVGLIIRSQKVVVDGADSQSGPPQRWVEIDLKHQGETVARQPVFLKDAKQEVVLDIPGQIDEVVIDPRRLFLEAEFADNRRSLGDENQ